MLIRNSLRYSTSPAPPVTDEIGVSALWEASAKGYAGSGYPAGTEPDPAAYITARLAALAKPQPSINILDIRSVVFDGDYIYIPVQIQLFDSRIGSSIHGRPVPCTLKAYAEGNTNLYPADTQKTYFDAMGRARERTCRWVKLKRPTNHLGPEVGGRGGEIRMYFEAIPNDLVNYAPRLIGPFSFFPRDASGVVEKTIAKTAGAGVDYTNVLAFWNAATTEFTNTGRMMRGKVRDSGKAWTLGLKAPSDAIPWKTPLELGLDLVTGLPSTGTLGDKTAFPSAGNSGLGLNRCMFEGFTVDQGGTGGIGPRNYGAGTLDEMAFRGCDMTCSGYPASATVNSVFYSIYGTFAGQSTLVRGRQPGGAVFTGNTYALKPNYYESVDTNWHDLPAMGMNRFAVIVNPVMENISGSPIQDTYGGAYGIRCRRFGGYYSGLATRPGDSNFSMNLTKTGSAYWGVDKAFVVGSASSALRFWTGVDAASATMVKSITTLQYSTIAQAVAAITAAPELADITATDLMQIVNLDATFLQVEGAPTTQPMPRTEIPSGAGIDLISTMDIHASGFAFTVGVGEIRMNISVVNCIWSGYCGAATTSASSADAAPLTEITYYDIYFGGCGWYDERGYLDRKGNWQDMGIELGYLNGGKSGFGMFACTFAAAPGTASSGAAFGIAPFRTMEYAVIGYCYGQFGNYPVGFSMIGIVSPYQSLPTGPTPPINSKFIGSVGVTKPATDVFNDAANDDFTLVPATTWALTPDGIGVAGIYDYAGNRQVA